MLKIGPLSGLWGVGEQSFFHSVLSHSLSAWAWSVCTWMILIVVRICDYGVFGSERSVFQ